MHFPRAYRSLPRPSSLTKPSHSPTGVFALYQVHHFLFTIAAPETLREHFRKATFFYTLSVIMLTSWMFPVILCTTVTADCSATSFIPYRNRELHILYFGHTNPQYQSFTQGCPARKTKEVIQPQVPLRLPCYDFSPVADPRFDSAN